MVYIQGMTEQARLFLFSVGFGFLLGILYDVFRTVRLMISNSAGFVLTMDILYFCVCAFSNFCFVMALDGGRVRAFIALGEALGWMIYYISFGAIAVRVTSFAVRSVHRAAAVIFKPFRRLKAKIRRKLEKNAAFLRKTSIKNDKNAKFLLQKHKSIVYNVLGYYKNCFLFKNRKD